MEQIKNIFAAQSAKQAEFNRATSSTVLPEIYEAIKLERLPEPEIKIEGNLEEIIF